MNLRPVPQTAIKFRPCAFLENRFPRPQKTLTATQGDDIPVGQPRLLLLDIAVFQERMGPGFASFTIYRVPHPMRGVFDLGQLDNVHAFCEIRCSDPGVLVTGLQLQLGMQVTGPAVQFTLFVNGQPVDGGTFSEKFAVLYV